MKNNFHKKGCVKMKRIIIVLAIVNFLLCNITFADFWTITQLTDNDYIDWRPSISGTNVVWRGSDRIDTYCLP